ncbi:MAG: tRNA pseudouridine(38-40) synthase TruA [Bacilli bacterium]
MKYLATVAYDGSKFLGFQRLNKGYSVQKSLEGALSVINKESVQVKGAGRTDRGVHAHGQKISFELNFNIPPERLKNAINSLVNDYIHVIDCSVVNNDFHARFSVKTKQYTYKINLGDYDPVMVDYIYQCPYKLDVRKMKKCAKAFKGIHDFHNFVSGSRDNYKAIIYKIKFKKRNNILEITFIGKSFYRYMVRNMIGALIEVGRGKEDIKKIKEMLKTKKAMSLFTAPSCGLYLDKIEY